MHFYRFTAKGLLGAMAAEECELCGLPLRCGNHTAVLGGQTRHFCCAGCKMVYSMLLEAAGSPTPDRFTQTELYRRCMAAGVVPAGEKNLPKFQTKAREAGKAGFQLDRHFRLEGMWCPACAWVIQTALEQMEGVIEARCSFVSDRLYCRYDPVKISPGQIAAAADQLGYSVFDQEDHGASWSKRRAFIKLIVSAILSANIMMLSWALYSGFFTTLSPRAVAYIGWPAAIMATVVLGYAGGTIFHKAWYGIRYGAPGMETLIGLGAGSAYLYSLVRLLQGSLQLYFDTAAMLITLLLLGKMLETQAKIKVRQDLDGFLALQPRKVRVCSSTRPEGRFTVIDQLRVGDVFRVAPDEVVPADGRIVRGQGLINAAAITGEPGPLSVGTGDSVMSGCILLEGSLHIETVKTGQQTMLGQMVAMVQRSLASKTVLEDRTERLLAFFVPLMAALAVLTGSAAYMMGLDADQAVTRAVTVLVIACPCALGIAIPLARVAGIAGAAKRGLLIRAFEVFERLPDMTTVVFDKTGTLTHGNWRLEHIKTFYGRSPEDIVALVCGLEGEGKHAVARAVEAYARARGIEPAGVCARQSAPEGVCGRFQDQTVCAGSWSYVMGDSKEAGPVPSVDSSADTESTVLSRVYVGAGGVLWAVLEFGDSLRPGVPALIRWLRDHPGDVHLVSGDSRNTTRAVATRLGITSWQGDLLPRDKAAYISTLQAAGQQVLMVGDAINDAPALAQADLAAAVYSGAPLAREAAEVILMRGSPTQLVELFSWSRHVDLKVRQNLRYALAYNLISVPVAMSGWLNPLVAVTAMLFSSLTVIGNTLFLTRRKPGENITTIEVEEHP